MALMICIVLGTTQSYGGTIKEEWYLMRGKANMKIGNMKAAIEAYEKAVEINPDNTESMRDLGLAYANEGLTDKAIQQFDRYLKKNPKDAEILFKQADFLSWKRYEYRRADALSFYKQGLDLKDDSNAHKKYAKLLGRDKKDYEQAITEYKKLVAELPGDESLRAEYRKLLVWDKKYLDDALEEYENYTSKYPKDDDAKHQYAQLLADEGSDLPHAESLLAEVSAKRGNPYDLELEKARIQANIRGREDTAVGSYKILLKRKYSANVDEELADLLARQKDTRTEALEHYRSLVANAPNNKRLRLKYGRLLLADRSNAAQAAQQFERVLDAAPSNGEAHQGAALAYSTLGEEDKALYHSQQADKFGTSSEDVRSIDNELSADREPRVGVRATNLHQPSSGQWRWNHSALLAAAKADPSAFSSISAEAGMERIKSNDEAASGALATVYGQYRFSEETVLDVSLGYHAIGLPDRRKTGSASLKFPLGGKNVAVKGSRDFRYDSLLAFKGKEINGAKIGGARTDTYGIEIADAKGSVPWKIFPYTGTVRSAESDENRLSGASGEVRFPFTSDEDGGYGFLYKGNTIHYDHNRSRFDQGGYFSPKLFINQAVQMFFEAKSAGEYFAQIQAGPTLQYIKDSDTRGKLVLGLEGQVGCYWQNIFDEYNLSFDLTYLRLPGVNFQLYGSLGASMRL
ncbi:MAG: tetratricopeptide repeat protein [Oligoflexales bacterium]